LHLENYDQLIANLDYGLEIQRILGPNESASRLFRQSTANLTQELNRNADLFTTMESGYRSLQEEIEQDRVMIGISLEENKKNNELVVSRTRQSFPAKRAGILPGDVVVKIDGKTTQGMAVQQALEILKGKPETSVELTVRRGNQELNFQLIRARVGVTSDQRRLELVEALIFFADYHKSLAERLVATQAKLTTLEKRIAQGQENPVEALLSVAEDLKNQKAKLDTEI
jgi:C-terminal processing protease CtpA/Prc